MNNAFRMCVAPFTITITITIQTMTILILTTIPATLYYFAADHIAAAKQRGYDVHLVCAGGDWVTASQVGEKYGVPVHVVGFTRRVSPLRDVFTLLHLVGVFLKVKPRVAHYSTPKAALLGAMAAWLTRVPFRLYTNRGLLHADAPGKKGARWRSVERLICRLSHRVTCNSPSNLEFIVKHNICPAGKVGMLANGSSHGVDAIGRFRPARSPQSTRSTQRETGGEDRGQRSDGSIENVEVRRENGVGRPPPLPLSPTPPLSSPSPSPSPFTIGFVGRLARDKGMTELAGAWGVVRERVAGSRLMIVGPDIEPWNDAARALLDRMKQDERVVWAGARDDVEQWYAQMDVLVLPSYREGFPNVALEAAAMELPVVTTDALGCRDAVRDGETGLIVPVRDTPALADAVLKLAEDADLRRRMGRAGRAWVVQDFAPERIVEELMELYERR